MARRLAHDVLMRIGRDGAYSHIALSAALQSGDLSEQDARLATELVYGTLTWRRAIDQILDRYTRGGTNRLDAATHEVLRLGVYQLVFLDRVPDHAATHEMVELAKSVANRGAASLANAVLRKVASADAITWWRDADRTKKPARYLADRWSLPPWLTNRLIQQFGLERAESLAEAYSRRPPLWARVVGTDQPERLTGLDAPTRARLDSGSLVIQDLGSQVVVRLAPRDARGTALDACAGVGGKTLYLAEHYERVVALDPLPAKLELLREATARLVRSNVEAHETTLEAFEPGERYDLVLVDAPCTGLGVMRRHPETRWTRREADITALAAIQARLLDEAAELVRPGGHLLYSVCTFTREETSRQVERLLERRADLEHVVPPDELDVFRDGEHYVRTFPDTHDCDGFFASLMVRH